MAHSRQYLLVLLLAIVVFPPKLPPASCNALDFLQFGRKATTLGFPELEGKQLWRGDNCGINQCGKPIVRAELLSEILPLEVQGRHCLNYSFPRQ